MFKPRGVVSGCVVGVPEPFILLRYEIISVSMASVSLGTGHVSVCIQSVMNSFSHVLHAHLITVVSQACMTASTGS